MTGLCKGSSDLIGWTIRDGVAVFVALEVKAPTGRVSKEQQNFIDMVVQSGGIAGVVKSLDDCDKLLYGV